MSDRSASHHAAKRPGHGARGDDGGTTGRLFVALWPTPSVRRALAGLQASIGWPEAARPTPAQDLHLTLVFIGPIPAAQLEALGDALAIDAPAFDLSIDAIQRWHAGLTVAVPSVVPDALRHRQQRVAQAVTQLGLPLDERPHRPHVTLARRGNGAVLPLEDQVPRVAWRGTGHVLAMREGAHYRVIRRYG